MIDYTLFGFASKEDYDECVAECRDWDDYGYFVRRDPWPNQEKVFRMLDGFETPHLRTIGVHDRRWSDEQFVLDMERELEIMALGFPRLPAPGPGWDWALEYYHELKETV